MTEIDKARAAGEKLAKAALRGMVEEAAAYSGDRRASRGQPMTDCPCVDKAAFCETHQLRWCLHCEGRCPECASFDEDDGVPPFDDRGGVQ